MNQNLPPHLTTAGFPLRLAGFAIDFFCLSFLLSLPLLMTKGINYQPPFMDAQQLAKEIPAWMRTLAPVGFFFYFSICEGLWATTPGKRLLGLRVVQASNGAPCGWRAAAQRDLLRVVDLFLLFGLLTIGSLVATRGRRTLGDMIAGTLVVQITRARTIAAGVSRRPERAARQPSAHLDSEAAEPDAAAELERGWYYARSGETAGPVAWDELWDLAVAGHLQSDDPVWHEHYGAEWIRAGAVPELKDALTPRRSTS